MILVCGFVFLVLGAWQLPTLLASAYRNVGSTVLLKSMYLAQTRAYDPLDPTVAGPSGFLQAAKWLNSASKWDTEDISSRRQSSLAHIAMGESSQAARELRAMPPDSHRHPMTTMVLASALHRMGDKADAIALWQEAEAGRLLQRFGDRALATKDLSRAAESYRLALQVGGDDANAELGLAEVYRALGNNDLGIAHYEAAFALGARSPEGADHLAKLLAGSERSAEAEKWLEQALIWHPDYPPYLLDLGDMYLATGRHADAGVVFALAVRTAPRWSWTRAKYGYYLATSGRLEDGLAEIEQAVVLDPDSRGVWALLARVYLYQVQDYEKALTAFERVVSLPPPWPWARFELGRLYAGAGQVEKARAEFEQALRLDPAYTPAADALGGLPAR